MQAVVVAVILIVVIVAGAVYYYYSTLPPAKEEIVIGTAIAVTGPYGVNGNNVLWGYKYWLEKVNEQGGLLLEGRRVPVRLVIYDDKSDPTVTKSLFERLITVDKCDFLLGPYTSSATFAVMPVAEKYKMVVMHPIASNPVNWEQGYEYQFHAFPATDDQNVRPTFLWMNSLPANIRPKTVAVVNTADFYPRSKASYVKQHIEEYGYELVYEEEIDKAATDVSTTIIKAKESGAEVFFITGFFPIETLSIATAKEQGYHPKVFVASTCVLPEFPDVTGAAGNNVIGTSVYHHSLDIPGNAEFNVDHIAEFGNPCWDQYRPSGVATATVLGAAIEGANSLDHDDIREWLLNNKVDTVTGTYEVDHDLAAQGRKYVRTFFTVVGQWQNGEYKIIHPLDVATTQAVYPRPPV
jgi:branched-chain amino acid transport system substrate-binding protein